MVRCHNLCRQVRQSATRAMQTTQATRRRQPATAARTWESNMGSGLVCLLVVVWGTSSEDRCLPRATSGARHIHILVAPAVAVSRRSTTRWSRKGKRRVSGCFHEAASSRNRHKIPANCFCEAWESGSSAGCLFEAGRAEVASQQDRRSAGLASGLASGQWQSVSSRGGGNHQQSALGRGVWGGVWYAC